jgi:hypothetical protein
MLARFGSRLGFGLTLALALVGCEKQQPPNANPPRVIVEQPGEAPTPATPDSPEPEADPEPAFGTTEIVATQIACQADADCVKATCCHATTCVAVSDGPDCSASTCTMDCRAGTMDCNGGCLCQAGKCAAKLWWAPSQ